MFSFRSHCERHLKLMRLSDQSILRARYLLRLCFISKEINHCAYVSKREIPVSTFNQESSHVPGRNNTKKMKLPLKMYLIMLVGVSVILYQYHLSKAWMLSQGNSQELGEMYHENGRRKPAAIHSDDTFTTVRTNLMEETTVTTTMSTPCLKLPPHLNDDLTTADLPPLYIITPTYKRPEQLAELTRLSHTLMLVPNVFWLVVEDADEKNPLVTELLERTGVPFEYLTAPMPAEYKKKKKGPKPRGVSNRNKGLKWIRMHATTGVFYFADDDNTYDLEIFHQMRFTKKVSMWPVGLITKLGVSSPIIQNGSFIGFYDGWIAGRKFPVDMAGFAVSVKFLLQRPNAIMPFKPGFEEDGFLKSLNPFEPHDIELLASNCTKILVWHTQTKKNEPSQVLDLSKYNNTNIVALKHILV